MSNPSDREILATVFNLFTGLHHVVSDGKHGIIQLGIFRDHIVKSLATLTTLPRGVAEGRALLEQTPPQSITNELLEKVEALVFGPIAGEIRSTPFKSTIVDVHDRARVLDLLDRLRASVGSGDTHTAFAFRALLVGALDQAGALSISKESWLLLKRASALLSHAYAAADVDFRSAIDAWQQDCAPLQAAADAGVTALQTARTLIANVPLEALTVDRLDEILGLLDGHLAADAVRWQ